MKILIVDDNPPALRLLGAQLEDEGHAVLRAADGLEALARLGEGPVDAVISDILMPNMDGYRLCQEVRRSRRWRDLPFIFYSATCQSPADEKLALRAGGDRFLAKPASADDIAAVLREVLARQRPAARAPAKAADELDVMRQYSARLVAKLEAQHAEALADRLRLETIVRAAKVGLWDWDLVRNQVYYSPEWKAQLGYADDELRNEFAEWRNRVHPDDLEPTLATVRRYLAAPWPDYHVEFRLRHKNGSWRWIHAPGALLRDAAGKPARMLGSHIDVTELKTAQEALEVAQAQAHLGSWELDLDTGEARWSREMYRLYGLDPAAGPPTIAGFLERIAPADRGLMRDLPKRLALGGGTASAEYRTDPERGPVRHLHLAAYGTPDATGRVHRISGTVLDVTERNLAREQLAQSLERARSLTRRLVESQEAEQRRLSAELHDRIGQNLTALCINVDLIGGALPAPLAAELAARLRDTRALLESTVASIRGLMRDLRPPVLEDYGLLAGVRAAGREFEARTHIATRVRGTEPVPRLPPPVELTFYRIVQEALTNAAKHARPRRIEITVGCDERRAWATVEDDGVGFDPAGSAADAERHWGLVMMRERAESVGGRLRVEAAPGHGTRIGVEVAVESP